ncbi:hypothetical protein NDU88_001257 [Pleurodeles waltl]|uniref:Uncharacterized protein n=1 Tax=Pleurodeles waltl TaxID=8319 RepID=A0AAV7SZ11_PLEWA|nr:hypothetical protein NDU88_001257 [Pleurodeles waltl]
MEPSKVVQALKNLQDEGREDLIKEGVLEQAGRKFHSKSATGRRVVHSPVETEAANEVVAVQSLGGVKHWGISSLPRRQGSSLGRRVSSGGRGSICRTAVSLGGRVGARLPSTHARIGAQKEVRLPLERDVERCERPLVERTSASAFKMAAPIADHHDSSVQVSRLSGAPVSLEAPGCNRESEVVAISDEEDEVQVSEGSILIQKEVGAFGTVSRKGGRLMQSIPRVVSPMLNKVQSWELSNQAVFNLGERIEFIDSSGAVFKGTVCGEASRAGSMGRAFVSLDFWQQESGEGPSGCDTSHAYSGHGVQVGHRRSGRVVGDQSLPVKVRVPSEHRAEGRVRSGAVHPTSGERIGAADAQPSTSQGAGVGWAYDDEELLDYEEELEEPVTSNTRVVVAREAPDVAQGGHVPAQRHELSAGNLPRGFNG